MSKQQPQRPQAEPHQDPVKYGDVFPVSGELASQPIAPQDAAAMQAAENIALGQAQKGGPASVMQSAAARNENIGVVSHDQATDIAKKDGVAIFDTNVAGNRIITEAVGGQVVGQYVTPERVTMTSPASALSRDAVSIGEALEATSLSAGDKPVDQSDAAAIQAAEMRATGRNVITPGGVAATAQSAADRNERTMPYEGKTKLAEVLWDATTKLPGDKPVTREDAEGVIGAELRNNPNMATHPGGVADSMAAAAKLNQN